MIIHTETIAKKIMVLEVNVSTCIMTATQKMVLSIMIIAITIMTTVIIIILNYVVSVDNNMRCYNNNSNDINNGKQINHDSSNSNYKLVIINCL